MERLPRVDPHRHRGNRSSACSAARRSSRSRRCTLVDWDPDAEDKLLAAICYPHANLPEQSVARPCAAARRRRAPRADTRYVGDRENRRHKPGRAFERVDYRFDVLSDYGAFRDLQRHRLLTIEWQRLTPVPRLRPTRPDRRSRARPSSSTTPMARSAALYDVLQDGASRTRPRTRSSMAYRLRYVDAVQRPRGDPHARAALVATGTSGIPAGGARDAPSDRRAGGSSGDRRCDDHMTMEAPELERLDVRTPRRGPPTGSPDDLRSAL